MLVLPTLNMSTANRKFILDSVKTSKACQVTKKITVFLMRHVPVASVWTPTFFQTCIRSSLVSFNHTPYGFKALSKSLNGKISNLKQTFIRYAHHGHFWTGLRVSFLIFHENYSQDGGVNIKDATVETLDDHWKHAATDGFIQFVMNWIWF